MQTPDSVGSASAARGGVDPTGPAAISGAGKSTVVFRSSQEATAATGSPFSKFPSPRLIRFASGLIVCANCDAQALLPHHNRSPRSFGLWVNCQSPDSGLSDPCAGLESGDLAQTRGWRQISGVRRLYKAWPPLAILWGKYNVVRSYWRQMLNHPVSSLRFLTINPETTNFTYDISNREDLISFLATELEIDTSQVRAMVAEIDSDDELRAELTAALRQRPDRSSVPLFGRRIGWYCVVRLCQPRLVVETGVHDGLGSSLLLAALRRNADEGHQGRLIAIDILSGSGWLVPKRLRTEQFSLVIHPSLDAIADISDPIDLFIHDSDHSESYEAAEYAAVNRVLSPRAILISDNAHVTSALRDLARNLGWHYAFWKESPADHFYGGAGIGIAVVGRQA